jgi:hypothetical protein
LQAAQTEGGRACGRSFSPLAVAVLEQGLKVMRSEKRDAAQRACLGAYLAGCLAAVLQSQAAPAPLAAVLLRLTHHLHAASPPPASAAAGVEGGGCAVDVFAPLVTLRSLAAAVAAAWAPAEAPRPLAAYGGAKVANREIRVWHGATENGP